jgi:TPP-dependent pyruvate/acetoin dehydrogenase alpha subunit
LFARRFKKISGTVGAACIGDGATSTGAFHEALNQAAVEKLPLVHDCADNQYAYSTPTSPPVRLRRPCRQSRGLRRRIHSVDGTDLSACLKIVGEAVAKARAGDGPQLSSPNCSGSAATANTTPPDYVDPN